MGPIKLLKLATLVWAICSIVALLLLAFLPQANVRSFIDENDIPTGAFALLALAWFTVPIVANEGMRTMWQRRREVILAHLDQALRLSLPLPEMLHAAADSERGTRRLRLLSLRYHLQHGESLADAIRKSVPEIPPETVRAIHAGEQAGRLPQTMARLVARAMPVPGQPPRIDRIYRSYAMILTVLLGVILITILSISVLPKLHSISRSFGLTLPWTTLLVESAYNSGVPFYIIGAPLLLLIACWPRASRDFLLNCIPIVRDAARNRALADLCAFVSDALLTGQPVETIITESADAQPNTIVRRHVLNWADRMTRGQSLSDAARSAGMPALLTGMLATVHGSDDLANVMAFLGRHYEYRFSRLSEVLRAAAIPCFVFTVGAMVLLVELSVFQPMIAMNSVLSAPHIHGGGF